MSNIYIYMVSLYYINIWLQLYYINLKYHILIIQYIHYNHIQLYGITSTAPPSTSVTIKTLSLLSYRCQDDLPIRAQLVGGSWVDEFMGVEAPKIGKSYGNHMENMSSFLGFEFKNLNSGENGSFIGIPGGLKHLTWDFWWFLVGFCTWIQRISPANSGEMLIGDSTIKLWHPTNLRRLHGMNHRPWGQFIQIWTIWTTQIQQLYIYMCM